MKWQNIEGWFSDSDAAFVQNICKDIHDGVAVELGFYAGQSTAVMAPICKKNNTVFHTVDNCIGADPRDPATKNQRSRDMKRVFENNMAKLQLLDCIKVHIMDSAASAELFDDESVDFCFIDASHVAEDVKRDIGAWWPKIKSGGVLGGHDWSWGSVRGVVEEFTQLHQLKFIATGNCWKIIKGEE